jgi:hypothetical protein
MVSVSHGCGEESPGENHLRRIVAITTDQLQSLLPGANSDS